MSLMNVSDLQAKRPKRTYCRLLKRAMFLRPMQIYNKTETVSIAKSRRILKKRCRKKLPAFLRREPSYNY